jgi:hypothetical protein
MRNGYWWIEATIGVLLILAPFIERFTQVRAALYTDVVLGILLWVWAAVGSFRYSAGLKAREKDMQATHA